mmetsp:Transcript_10575/g.28936  ORF Transcript_10575/g.28936 Transcript_10575/m.28936 type:complete len:212 (-) Transcript_10575:697-1332(-)
MFLSVSVRSSASTSAVLTLRSSSRPLGLMSCGSLVSSACTRFRNRDSSASRKPVATMSAPSSISNSKGGMRTEPGLFLSWKRAMYSLWLACTSALSFAKSEAGTMLSPFPNSRCATLLCKWGTMVSMKRRVAGLLGSNSSAFSAVTMALTPPRHNSSAFSLTVIEGEVFVKSMAGSMRRRSRGCSLCSRRRSLLLTKKRRVFPFGSRRKTA